MNPQRALELAERFADAGFRVTIEVLSRKNHNGATYHEAELTVTATSLRLDDLRELLVLSDEARASVSISGELEAKIS